jgi:hypothetical protein
MGNRAWGIGHGAWGMGEPVRWGGRTGSPIPNYLLPITYCQFPILNSQLPIPASR